MYSFVTAHLMWRGWIQSRRLDVEITMIGALISLIVYVIILAVLYWLVNYVLDNFPLPEPANRIVRVAVVIIIVLAAIHLVLGVFGIAGFETPRLIRGM